MELARNGTGTNGVTTDEFINFADAFGTGMCEVVVAYPGTTSVSQGIHSTAMQTIGIQ